QAVMAKAAMYVEAPVSGSKKPAEDGTLVILAAGSAALLEQAQPLFDVVGKRTFTFAKTGQGTQIKLVVNMLLGTLMSSFCEGLSLVKTLGMDPTQLLEVLEQGALQNPVFRFKGPNILNGAFSPAFPLKHMQKDMQLALELGNAHHHPLPTISSANTAFQRALRRGDGDLDFAAVWNAIQAEQA
ncbi:MAG: NAD(P)-dependent oxidoreductase, partial [Myxococcota bacterium]